LKEAGCERIQVEACGKAFRRKVKAGGDNNYKNGSLKARYTGWMLRGQAKRRRVSFVAYQLICFCERNARCDRNQGNASLPAQFVSPIPWKPV